MKKAIAGAILVVFVATGCMWADGVELDLLVMAGTTCFVWGGALVGYGLKEME